MHEAHANGPSPSSHMHELKTCRLATKTYKKYYNLIFYFYFQNIFQKYRKIKFSMHFIIHMPISRFLLLISF
jgi:hypothetical protein